MPIVRDARVAEERNRAYLASPSCRIYRDYARPLRRNLLEHFASLPGETKMTASFDGRVLSFGLEEHNHEVVAYGDTWPSSFRVTVSPESRLPSRFESEVVDVRVFEDSLSFDRVHLGPCEPVP